MAFGIIEAAREVINALPIAKGTMYFDDTNQEIHFDCNDGERRVFAGAKDASKIITTDSSNVQDKLDTFDDSLTASNGQFFYFDFKNGKAGWNSSPTRGADTFHPFKEPNLVDEWTVDGYDVIRSVGRQEFTTDGGVFYVHKGAQGLPAYTNGYFDIQTKATYDLENANTIKVTCYRNNSGASCNLQIVKASDGTVLKQINANDLSNTQTTSIDVSDITSVVKFKWMFQSRYTDTASNSYLYLSRFTIE